VQAEDDEKRKALELALERARYEANRARRQFDAVEPENRLVASELEARWNDTLEQVAALEARMMAMGERSAPIRDEKKAELLALGEDVRTLWDHPEAPVQLKKRILRTVLKEIMVQSERASPTHRLILHWAGGVHTELYVERNPTGQHRRKAEREVIDLVSELAKVCPDKAIAAILNRLGYKTGQEKSWNASRVAGLRGYHNIVPFQKQEGWVTQEQAAEELKVSNTVIKRLIREGVLPATQVVACAPWVIKREDLDRSAVQARVRAVQEGRRLPLIVPGQDQLPLE
jgi:excisionase family DNA binding protein